MTESSRAEHVTREAILARLSDEEIAKVSTAEAARELPAGSEYLDLEHLELGVRRASATVQISMGQILPRTAVHPETWTKILAQLARR